MTQTPISSAWDMTPYSGALDLLFVGETTYFDTKGDTRYTYSYERDLLAGTQRRVQEDLSDQTRQVRDTNMMTPWRGDNQVGRPHGRGRGPAGAGRRRAPGPFPIRQNLQMCQETQIRQGYVPCHIPPRQRGVPPWMRNVSPCRAGPIDRTRQRRRRTLAAAASSFASAPTMCSADNLRRELLWNEYAHHLCTPWQCY